MKDYKIIHKEELIGHYYIEAESEEEALSLFHKFCSEGKIDFSDLSMVDSEDTAEECK